MHREWLDNLIEASERPMLLLAALAVGIYLVDLQGLWQGWGLYGPYTAVALVIDLAFVVDLLLKVAVKRGAYLRSPWFVVDVVCALPIFSTVAGAPTVLQGLRFVRMFRILRALRMLRVLRSVRLLREASDATETKETVRYNRVLTASVLIYAVVFVVLVSWGQHRGPPGEILGVDGSEVATIVAVKVRGEDGAVQTLELPREQVFAQPNDPELFLVLGSLIGMFLILVVARYQIPDIWSRQMQALLNVALPEQVAQYLMDHPDDYDANVRMPATVIFCDIKGFTSTVEKLSLEDLKRHLERALDAVVESHRAEDLIIDKFIGDAVMSFRGGNIAGGDSHENAYAVVRGALNGIAALRALDDPYFKEIKVGGASAADMLIGAFGTSRRLSYTVLGDRVNLAARLEGSCNAVGVTNLFCDETHRLVAEHADILWRRVGWIRVQGKDEITLTWQAFDHADPVDWIPAFHAALDTYEAGEFAAAIPLFEQVGLSRPGGDGPSDRYLAACQRCLATGVADDWRPVLETQK